MQHIAKPLVTVFRRPRSILLTLIIAAGVLLFAIWLPNVSLLWEVLTSTRFDIATRLAILGTAFDTLQSNFTFTSRWLTIVIALLTGVHVTLLLSYIKQRASLITNGAGIVGTVAGLIGVGCASCGSVILSSIIGLGATSSFIGFLPLDGEEFGLLGVALLSWATYRLLKKMQQPLVCNQKPL